MASEQENQQENQQEIKRLAGILSTTAKLAEDASLKGSFSGGERRCILQYNAVLHRLHEIKAAPEGLFLQLPEGASFGAIGVACSQLAAYLKNELNLITFLEATAKLAERATRRGSHRGAEQWCIPQYNALLNWLESTNALPSGLFIALDEEASFAEVGIAYSQLAAYLKNGDDEDTEDPFFGLKNIGDLVRQAMPDFLKEDLFDSPLFVGSMRQDKKSESGNESRRKGTTIEINDDEESALEEVPAEQEAVHHTEAEPDPPEPTSEGIDPHLAELREQIQAIATKLGQGGLSPEETQALTNQLQQLTRQMGVKRET